MSTITDKHIELKRQIDDVNQRIWKIRGIQPGDSFDPVKAGLEAYEKSVEIDYAYGKGRGLINLGMRSFIMLHNYDLAMQQLTEAISILKELDEKQWVANAMLTVAIISTSSAKSETALFHAIRAVDFYDNNSVDDFEDRVMAYYTIGTVYKDIRKYDECVRYYTKGMNIPGVEKTMWGGRIMAGLSNVFVEQERYDEAIELSLRSLKVLDEQSNPIGQSRVLNDIGIIYKKQKDYQNALDYFFRSLEIRERGHLKQFVLSSLTEIAAVYSEIGETGKAIDYLKRAEETAIEINQPNKLAKIYSDIGAIYKASGQFNLALEYVEKFIAITSEIHLEERNKKIENLQNSLLQEKEQEIERLRNVELKNAYDVISEKNKEILDSINYAKRIQAAILPPARLWNEALPESFVLYKPKDIVAGDFYWLERRDDQVLFAAADCTGHGVPGALVSVICNNGLNRSVREYGLTDPGLILDKTREIIVAEFEKSEDEVKDGMDISLGSLWISDDGSRAILLWSGANNPLWIIRGGSGEFEEIKPDKQPIGKFAAARPFTTHEVLLTKGDTLYIFTDGYQDQFGGEKGKKFRASELKELLLASQNKNMVAQKKILDDAFEKWKGNLEQIDDVCVIGVRI
jgi:serine phosphatase RsbU (regulator of sigma subunit)